MQNNIFSRHIKGETSNFYLEIYCMKYKEHKHVLELNIYKDSYTKDEIDNIVSEYHKIIDTFEIV